jgi:hypothetical protein
MQIPSSNISGSANIGYLSAMSEDDLLAQIRQIKLPFKILGMYSVGSKHIAWLTLTNPIKKRSKKTDISE